MLLLGSWCVSNSWNVLSTVVFVSLKGSEWKERAEILEVELQQCYKAQSRVSEQLVVETAESKASKALVQEKETAMVDVQMELTQARLLYIYFMF